jgi:hypothetical protein
LLLRSYYRDKKVVGVFVRFRAPLQQQYALLKITTTKSENPDDALLFMKIVTRYFGNTNASRNSSLTQKI